MGKVNILLKRSYVCVISVIAILAILMLGLTLFAHGMLHHLEEEDHGFRGLQVMYGTSAIILIFAIIGGFGVWKEKKWALIMFTVGMILGCLYFMFVLHMFAPATKSKREIFFKDRYLSMLPLSNMSQSDLMELESAQRNLHCCGLTSFEDWENNIPESCQCDSDSPDDCVDISMRNNSLQDLFNTKPSRIYAKPCLPVLAQIELSFIPMVFGIVLGNELLWILSVGLCIAILCQLNKKVETPKVIFSPEAKAGNYCNLNDSKELTLEDN
ncbi:tetraspanin-8-like [Anableps anableps]